MATLDYVHIIVHDKSSYIRDRLLLLSWISHDTETNRFYFPYYLLSLLRTRRVGIRSSLASLLALDRWEQIFIFRSSLDLHDQKFIQMILHIKVVEKNSFSFFSNHGRMFFCILKFKFLYFAFFLNIYFTFCEHVRNKKIFIWNTFTFLFVIFLW